MSTAHNPDANAAWTPKIAYRIYACNVCAAETTIQTNHTGAGWWRCAGSCREIFNPGTSRESVQWHPLRRHHFIREAN